MSSDERNTKLWHQVLHDGFPEMEAKKRIFKLMPSHPRCSVCFSPFGGVGGTLLRVFTGRRPSIYNPIMCTDCEVLVREYPGGAEVTLSMLFADVRGSTSIAEKMTPLEFSRLMDRFYTVSTTAMMQTNGLIEKFVGDNVTALFPPGIAGQDHARQAVQAAQYILKATGHGQSEPPWLPVGAGVHTGHAFVGSVGSGGVSQLTALGDAVNAAARLAGSAAAGEILVTEDTCRAAHIDTTSLEQRDLLLKGKTEPLRVYVMRVDQ